MTIRKLTALLIKIIAFFLFLKGFIQFSLTSISILTYLLQPSSKSGPLDISMSTCFLVLICNMVTLLLPVLFIVKADWLAARIANDNETVKFPERWFHRDVLLVGIFLLGMYFLVDGATGIANILAGSMRFAPEGWRPRLFAPAIRLLLGALFAFSPKTVLRITGQGTREE